MIALDISALGDGPGGIPTVVRGLAEGLRSRGDEVAFISRSRRRSYEADVDLDDVVAAASNAAVLPRQVWMQFVAPALLRHVRADVFISPAFVTPLRAPCKTITIVHDSTPFSPWRRRGVRECLLRAAIRHTFASADAVVFPSHSVRGEFQELGLLRYEQRAAVVHWGVHDRFLACERAGGAGVVWSGSAVSRKDWRTMEAAVGLSGLEDLQLLGPGANGNDASPEDVVRMLAEAEVLVVTSRYEGFSLPVVEARALGLPVVCTDIPVHREVAAAESTWFFPPGDSSALAAILRNQPWRRIQHRRSWDRTWANVADAMIAITGELGRS